MLIHPQRASHRRVIFDFRLHASFLGGDGPEERTETTGEQRVLGGAQGKRQKKKEKPGDSRVRQRRNGEKRVTLYLLGRSGSQGWRTSIGWTLC